ncbi:MAG TPA: hypothetical protein VK206_22285, partial [Anaerolineales bacterium]|nr:hypothetical protein [Anaerolineales bacterium]
MKEKRMKILLENIASRAVPEDMNLMLELATRLERKSIPNALRARPILTLLLVLLALMLLSGIVYAIGKVAGYIPGVGIFDENLPLRTLAEPVSVTRDGVSLTIEQVVLSADKTVVIYKIEGIPADTYGGGTEENSNASSYSSSSAVPLDGTPDSPSPRVYDDGTCLSEEHLLLPNGSLLPLQTAEGSGWSSGFESRQVYGPISVEINDATFVLSCIPQTKSGKLPENWEVPLHFSSASPSMKLLPVVELTVSAEGHQNPMILERTIETDDGYILIGKFRSIGLPEHAIAYGSMPFLKITDGNGQVVNAAHVNGMDVDTKFGEFALTYEIKGKNHAWPLTLVMDRVIVLFDQQSTEFEFDTGPSPHVGQTWTLHPGIQLMGYAIHEVTIERT